MENFEKQNFAPEEEWKNKAHETHQQDQQEAEEQGGYSLQELMRELKHRTKEGQYMQDKELPEARDLREAPEKSKSDSENQGEEEEISPQEAEAFIRGVFMDVLSIVQNDELPPEDIDSLYKSLESKNYNEISEILERYADNASNEHLRDTALFVVDRINGKEFKKCVDVLRGRGE